MNDHTRPERFTELQLARQRMRKVLADPCRFCLNRGDTFWNRTFCKVDGRTFFACKDGRSKPSFELDEKQLGEVDAI